MTHSNPTPENSTPAEADGYAEQFAASAEQVLEQMKADVQALLDSLPADAATSLINDPERELLDVEVSIATGLERMLDAERGNKFLNEDYVAFFKAAVAVDPVALETKNKIQAILEVLEEDDAVALVRDPYRALTTQEASIINALGDPSLTEASGDTVVLSADLSQFLADNVRVADDV